MNEFQDQSNIAPEKRGEGSAQEGGADYIPRPKRIACILCRRRKLKCDGCKPSCGTCSRLGHDCAYDEVRKKSGPKRGYVKQLEARLAQVETLLKSQDGPEKQDASPPDFSAPPSIPSFQASQPSNSSSSNNVPDASGNTNMIDSQLNFMDDPMFDMNNDFTWEMVSLGVEEPLPDSEVTDELYDIYFKKIHPTVPVIHRPRFFAALSLSPHMKPPIALRYAIWTHAASVTPKYESVVQHFYTRARKYAEADEMKGHGEHMVSLSNAQTWSLLAAYEFKTMYFPRAWQSVGRATRLCQMMGLHRLDGVGLDVKQCLPPPRDWIEREERRRTFWAAFCHDRYASIGTGWPMTIDERDILTALPASDDAFEIGRAEHMPSLEDVMSGKTSGSISSYGGVCLMACLFGRNFHHLHRQEPEENEKDLNGPFWKRHRTLDNVLLSTSLSLPSYMKLPQGLSDPNAIYCNMNLHTSTIFLHQAAIFKADKNKLQSQISAESKRRCIIAAEQITNIMKMISSMDLSMMNPFTSFALYVAARVFIQYLKSVPDDEQAKSSLRFLLTAMQVFKESALLTESFIAQLDVDLEGSGLDSFRNATRVNLKNPALAQTQMHDSARCSPLVEISENQASEPHRNPFLPQTTTPSTEEMQRSNPFPSSGPSMQQTPSPGPLPGAVKLVFGKGSLDNPSIIQEVSLSPGGGVHSDRSHSTSDHATPSTMSNKDSSNTSSYSPNVDSTGNMFSNMQNVQGNNFPLFHNNSTLTYNLANHASKRRQQSNVQQPQQVVHDIGGFDPNSWTVGAGSGLTPKDSSSSGWTPQIDDEQWAQPLEGMGWNGWNEMGTQQ